MNVCELAPINLDQHDSLLVAAKQITQLRTQGFSMSAIAKMVGLPPETDRTWDGLTIEVAKLLEAEHSDAIEVPVSMVVAARQCLRFRKLGFDTRTARLVCGLPRKDGASWDETMEDIARVWEELDSVKKANAAETPCQEAYTH